MSGAVTANPNHSLSKREGFIKSGNRARQKSGCEPKRTAAECESKSKRFPPECRFQQGRKGYGVGNYFGVPRLNPAKRFRWGSEEKARSANKKP